MSPTKDSTQGKCPLVLVRPDEPSKCTWAPNSKPADSPHFNPVKPEDRSKILPNILHSIGEAPLVRLNRIPQSMGIKCEMLAKCEFLNPGGSVKDRIAFQMVVAAEEDGLLKPGYTIIEPTSGNTGIGLAMAAAVRGYRCIIVMPEKMSDEKANVLKALGAEIVRTPTEAAWNSYEGHIHTAQRLNKQIPNSIILDQYRNANNPLAHYYGTGEEIVKQCSGELDMVVLTAGTGGTVTGIGRKIKEINPNIQLIAVDPEGSILALPEEKNETDVKFYEVEGIGYDFIPTVLDRSIVDEWYKTNDKESLLMTRRLIKEEGLLCGGSSGSVMVAALKAAASLSEGQRCVVLLPDGVRNYMTKLVSDEWMEERGFTEKNLGEERWWWNFKVNSMKMPSLITVISSSSCGKVLESMKQDRLNEIPYLDSSGLKGVILFKDLFSKITSDELKFEDPISLAVTEKFPIVHLNDPMSQLYYSLKKDGYAVIFGAKDTLQGVVTMDHFLGFLQKK